MRPARKGPENRRRRGHVERGLDASMRPARKGPENRHRLARLLAGHLASMRPARKGPENLMAGGGRVSPAGLLQ